ncbi:MAG: helix-turn-helix transcriptional regulator [Flavobacteriaceae bacterium]|jgi:transcriptional regulator with XRE-family HTH domain
MSHNLAHKIKKIREFKGYSQEYVAGKLALSQRAYSKIESGETRLHWERVLNISNILEIEPQDLIDFDETMIFNNCSQSGKLNTVYNVISEELKTQYEERIAHLEKEIDFLRGQLAANS